MLFSFCPKDNEFIPIPMTATEALDIKCKIDPPIYLHLIFAILQFEILSDELDFFPSLNWIFLPAVACKIQE